jgi:hypothetical protein
MAKPCFDASGFCGCIVNDLHEESFIYKLSVAFCKPNLADRYTVNNTGFPVDGRNWGGKDGWGGEIAGHFMEIGCHSVVDWWSFGGHSVVDSLSFIVIRWLIRG